MIIIVIKTILVIIVTRFQDYYDKGYHTADSVYHYVDKCYHIDDNGYYYIIMELSIR